MTTQPQPAGVRKVTFQNDSGETVPAYACIQLTGTTTLNSRVVFTADQWDGDGSDDIFYFNGPIDVADGETGEAFQPNTAQWVLYDTEGTPAFQEEWGPVSGSWEIGSDGTGFIIMGGATDGRVLAVAKGGGGCEDRNEIWKFIIGGSPTAGSFTFDLNVLGTTEEMEFQFDDTATEVQTELETHTKIASGDVLVTGGPFPDVDIQIEFQGDLANHLMSPPTTIDFSGLTGGTGTVVIPVFVRPGHPSDGSVAP